MGMQSAAVNEIGFSNFSTTFLTGTLTWLVSSLARPGGDPAGGLRRLFALFALAAGACLSGLLVANAARAVPVLALVAMVVALVLARIRAGQAAFRGGCGHELPGELRGGWRRTSCGGRAGGGRAGGGRACGGRPGGRAT